MTTATSSLVAITPGGEITDEHIAGSYTWYSVPEDMLSLRKVRKAFADNGLDVSRLPTERRPEHVAQEAVRQIERTITTTNGGGKRHREEIRVEFPMRTGDIMISQVTRHVQHQDERVVEHPKALRVIYDFQSSTLSFEPLEGATRQEVQAMVDEIQGNFDANATRIPGHKLRTILRHYLEAAGAENMRGQSGGVYFLAKQNRISRSNKLHDHHGDSIDGQQLLAQFRDMLTQLYGVADMHIVPCINDAGQREFLKRKFIENCADDLKTYRDECLELVRGKDDRKRAFREDKRARMVERRKDIDIRRQRFAEILGETLEELDRDMSLADKALGKFLTEADA